MISSIVSHCMLGLLLFHAGCTGTPILDEVPEDDAIRLSIQHYKMPCTGESAQLCYVIRKDNGEKEFFYSEIEGFEYQWGFNYTISVEKKAVGKPMSDRSSFTYRLKEVIRKEAAPAEETFELLLRTDEQSLITTASGRCSYFGKIRIQAGAIPCGDLEKGKSGVFKHSSDKRELVLVSMK